MAYLVIASEETRYSDNRFTLFNSGYFPGNAFNRKFSTFRSLTASDDLFEVFSVSVHCFQLRVSDPARASVAFQKQYLRDDFVVRKSVWRERY